MSVSVLRGRLADALAAVEQGPNRLLITRRGRAVAGLVTALDFERLAEMHRSSLAQKELKLQIAMEEWHRAAAVTEETVRGVLVR
ncbi:MAG: type II toxin-antitoxin system prevent-host-death family antitoxin [Cognatishimia sp.]